MPVLFLYLLKFSIAISVVYLFYRLVLQRLTFYRYNRWYLLIYSLCCFIIPFIDVSPLLPAATKAPNHVIGYVPVVQQWVNSDVTLQVTTGHQSNLWQAFYLIAMLGMGLLVIRLLVQYISFYRIKRKAILLQTGTVRLYQLPAHIPTFSFGNAIYLNADGYTEAELTEMVQHEFVHVSQKHTLDILLAELICVLNWYNPFAWLLRHAIRQNLEFVADAGVLHHGVDRKAYQYLLLKATGNPQFSLASPFNFSSLKKRIEMMNKIKTAKVQLAKFLLVIPIVVLLLLAFRRSATSSPVGSLPAIVKMPTDTMPETDDPQKNIAAFVKANPGVQKLRYKLENYGILDMQKKEWMPTACWLYVDLKSGQTERYNIDNETHIAEFKQKYGIAPAGLCPPPPPPPPPMDMESLPDEEKGVKSIRFDNQSISVILVNNEVEYYNISKPEEKAAYIRRFGEPKMIPVPPPSPGNPAPPPPGNTPPPPPPPGAPSWNDDGLPLRYLPTVIRDSSDC